VCRVPFDCTPREGSRLPFVLRPPRVLPCLRCGSSSFSSEPLAPLFASMVFPSFCSYFEIGSPLVLPSQAYARECYARGAEKQSFFFPVVTGPLRLRAAPEMLYARGGHHCLRILIGLLGIRLLRRNPFSILSETRRHAQPPSLRHLPCINVFFTPETSAVVLFPASFFHFFLEPATKSSSPLSTGRASYGNPEDFTFLYSAMPSPA